jgi:hypothetical protein
VDIDGPGFADLTVGNILNGTDPVLFNPECKEMAVPSVIAHGDFYCPWVKQIAP